MIVALPTDIELLQAVLFLQPFIKFSIWLLLITYTFWYLRIAIELIAGQPISTLVKTNTTHETQILHPAIPTRQAEMIMINDAGHRQQQRRELNLQNFFHSLWSSTRIIL
ncbi:8969_t:CDS:2 [Ambispora gerdemannii]|uniref:8969_t:CDS:1 n=1 Tax=Ambispora gerdemannii TaxID=144530 RepID=A0A9N8ZB67_9GLOM|nr:8969_t:CDS:2 [Ambispora gerdemannii]